MKKFKTLLSQKNKNYTTVNLLEDFTNYHIEKKTKNIGNPQIRQGITDSFTQEKRDLITQFNRRMGIK